MSYLDKLLQGVEVEWNTLGITCEIKTGKGITKSDSSASALYPIISGGKEPMGYYDKFNRLENTVTISRVGANAGYVSFIQKKFYLNDKCFSVLPIEEYRAKIDNKFLFYILKAKETSISELQSEGGVPTINTTKVGSIYIPIPPLPVQEKIVGILDKFTELTSKLTAELTVELTARKLQYNYYREKLLNFEEGEVEWKRLGEVAIFANGKGHEREIIENGRFIVVNSKFISTNGFVAKYSDNQICPLFIDDILIVMSDLPNGKTLAKTFIVDKNERYTLNQRIGGITIKDKAKLIPKFLNYYLNRTKQLTKYDNGVDQTNLQKQQILNVQIPIPPIAEQERIVSILDKFDTLTTSISEGLPKEIELRKKQYEYYRDRLLTFK